MKPSRYALPLLLLLSITCFAQDGVATKVDDYIRAEMQAQQFRRVAAVIRDREIVLANGYGLANIEHQVPVKPETWPRDSCGRSSLYSFSHFSVCSLT